MSGRAFLQIPGPTNIPDRVLRAMDRPVVDHRSPEFAELTEDGRVGLPTEVERRLRADSQTNPYRALLIVHNETSTGVTCDVGAIREAMDAAGHDALLIVDTVSSLASIDFRMDAWRVDIVICGSQKGL